MKKKSTVLVNLILILNQILFMGTFIYYCLIYFSHNIASYLKKLLFSFLIKNNFFQIASSYVRTRIHELPYESSSS